MRYECPGCHTLLPVEAFYPSRHRSNGISYYCRQCARAQGRAKYQTYRAGGKCGCGNPRLWGFLSCKWCVADSRRRKGSRPWRPGGRGRPPGRSEESTA
jgi:hypothetical protein